MDRKKAESILESYSGGNWLINKYKRGESELDSFACQYIMNSHDFREAEIGKTFTLAKWYGDTKFVGWGLEEPSYKLYVERIYGHTNTLYHVRAMYRRSVGLVNMFIPKSAIIGDLSSYGEKEPDIDFDSYDSMCRIPGVRLKEHQKSGVRFLLKKKWAILGDDMGLGKTKTLIITALAGGYSKVLVICPVSLKTNWKTELSQYVDESEIEIVKGNKWKEGARFTIINYDILDNFYEVPMEPSFQTVTSVIDSKKISKKVPIVKTVTEKDPETGEEIQKEVPVMKVSRKKKDIRKAMENSQLYQSGFDMVIIDECHKLSNSTSGRYAIVSDLIKRLEPESVIPVTGTLITNRPENFYNILRLINHPITKDYDYYRERYCGCERMTKKGEWDRLFLIWSDTIGNTKAYHSMDSYRKEHFKKFFDENKKCIWVGSEPKNLDELMEATKDCYIRRLNKALEGLPRKELQILEYDLTKTEYREYGNEYDKYAFEHGFDPSGYSPTVKELTEMTVLRMFAAEKMVKRTIKLADKHIAKGEKVVIICNFDKELELLSSHFGSRCVTYNGKMSVKQKDAAVKSFTEDEGVMAFIGNLASCGVGITLTVSHICIFNSLSYVPSDILQAQDRVYRIGQKEDVTVYYQIFNDTISRDIYEKVIAKEMTINAVIADESKK